MKKPNLIVIHCSATREGKEYSVDDIRKMHKARGFSDVGYHFIISLDGKIQQARPLCIKGAHVRGHNTNSIGVCYIGGLDDNGGAKDTRTDQQKAALERLLSSLLVVYPSVKKILGHRDLSPDLDGDGVVESHEWMKQCPCFNAIDDYKKLLGCQ